MLPIVKRKTLEIPHGLAAVAAAICLILAFVTDFSDRDRPDSVLIGNNPSPELIARQAATSGDDQATATENTKHHSGETRAPVGTSALINWFGLSR